MKAKELSDLCDTYLYSESKGSQRRRANNYLIKKVAHPDEGSNFDFQVGRSKYVFRIPIVNKISIYDRAAK